MKKGASTETFLRTRAVENLELITLPRAKELKREFFFERTL
jgi:hypothetical protein